jgi:hypothetical protein
VGQLHFSKPLAFNKKKFGIKFLYEKFGKINQYMMDALDKMVLTDLIDLLMTKTENLLKAIETKNDRANIDMLKFEVEKIQLVIKSKKNEVK